MSRWFFNILETVEGTRRDYEILAPYHYRTEPIAPPTNIYKIKARYPHHKTFPDPIAVIVYCMPIPALIGRNITTKNFFHNGLSRKERMHLINANVRYIARVIVDPRFRNQGLATKLITETPPLLDVPIVETLTPIDFTNKIFQRAGFELFYSPAPTYYRRFTNVILKLGLDVTKPLDPTVFQKRLNQLKGSQKDTVEHETLQFIKYFRHRAKMPPGLDRTKFILTKIPYPQAYLIWFNPQKPLYNKTGEKIGGTPPKESSFEITG